MQTKKVAIDIDGVITDVDFVMNCLSIFKKNKKDIHTVLDSKPSVTYKNNRLIRYLEFKGIHFYSKHAKIRDNASKALNMLKENGIEIHLVSKREFAEEDSKYGQKVRAATELYFLEHDIPYDFLVFTDDKLDYCQKNDIKIIVEDSASTIVELSSNMQTVCQQTPYNRHIKNGVNIFTSDCQIEIATFIINFLNSRRINDHLQTSNRVLQLKKEGNI